MPIDSGDLVVLHRYMAKAMDMALESLRPMRTKHDIKLRTMERVCLLEVKMRIDEILAKCKDDGY